MPTTTSLERGVLEQLGALRINGRPELLVRAISLYLVESPKLVQRLKQAASANDAPEIARCAHSLKSSSANVGASALGRYCGDIEGVGAPSGLGTGRRDRRRAGCSRRSKPSMAVFSPR